MFIHYDFGDLIIIKLIYNIFEEPIHNIYKDTSSFFVRRFRKMFFFGLNISFDSLF